MFDVLKTLSTLVKQKKTPVPAPDLSGGKTSFHDPRLASVDASHKKSASTPDLKKDTGATSGSPLSHAEAQAEIAIARARAKEILLEAKDEALQIRRDAEEELRKKLEAIERRERIFEEREERVRSSETITQKIRAEIEKIKRDELEKLERLAHTTTGEARTILIEEVRLKLKEEIAKELREAQAQAKEEAQAKAREILVDAMRHGATDYVAEYTVSVVKIGDDDMKGRIIGKEGRNIRAFEAATGVDVDLDEEGIIRLSSFDPVRREIARVSLERLLKDGRVQPGRIEEIIEQVKKEIERIMFEEGQKLCHAVGVYNLPAPLVALLGRFKYRFSYGQNMVAHTLEETKIGIALAQEVGADVNVVRLGCLLHDIGKVVMDKEGSHVELGVEVLRKYSMPQNVIACVAEHHEDTPFSSIESMLVYISDAISGSRPGARYENYEEYIKRLKSLEEIAKGYSGVREAFAFQAGRELRVAVDPGSVDDASATIMAQKIKEDVEKKLTYPGQIKITVLRELRAVEIAK